MTIEVNQQEIENIFQYGLKFVCAVCVHKINNKNINNFIITLKSHIKGKIDIIFIYLVYTFCVHFYEFIYNFNYIFYAKLHR